jgi:hypothetical protein
MRAVFVLAFVVVWCVGCEQQEERQPKRMQFAVDSSLLGDTVELTARGVRFRPPRMWQALTGAQVDQVKQALARSQSDSFSVRPARVFMDDSSQSLLIASTLNQPDARDFSQHMQAYARMLNKQHGKNAVRKTKFRKENLQMTQFLVQNRGRVNFKLIFDTPAPDLVQLDYVVPQDQYRGEVKSIESSIGSIHLTRSSSTTATSQP